MSTIKWIANTALLVAVGYIGTTVLDYYLNLKLVCVQLVDHKASYIFEAPKNDATKTRMGHFDASVSEIEQRHQYYDPLVGGVGKVGVGGLSYPGGELFWTAITKNGEVDTLIRYWARIVPFPGHTLTISGPVNAHPYDSGVNCDWP